jgi:hypothetical protein
MKLKEQVENALKDLEVIKDTLNNCLTDIIEYDEARVIIKEAAEGLKAANKLKHTSIVKEALEIDFSK